MDDQAQQRTHAHAHAHAIFISTTTKQLPDLATNTDYDTLTLTAFTTTPALVTKTRETRTTVGGKKHLTPLPVGNVYEVTLLTRGTMDIQIHCESKGIHPPHLSRLL